MILAGAGFLADLFGMLEGSLRVLLGKITYFIGISQVLSGERGLARMGSRPSRFPTRSSGPGLLRGDLLATSSTSIEDESVNQPPNGAGWPGVSSTESTR